MTRETTRSNYDRLSRWYDLFSSSERRFTETGLRLLDPKPDEAILEIGFGTGHALAALAQTARVWGIDLSPGMLAVTEEHLRRAGLLDRVTLQLGDATRLPFPDGMFDAVFLSFTLELFPEDEIPRVLAECTRVLRAGGRLGVVALMKKDSRAVRIYDWFHAKMPRVVDCRPIHVEAILAANRFDVQEAAEASIWGLPASAVLAVKKKNKKTGASNDAPVSVNCDGLQPDPHVTKIVSATLRANQTNTGHGNNHKNTYDSKHDHGDLLSIFLYTLTQRSQISSFADKIVMDVQ